VIAQDTPTGIKALAAGKRVRARTALGLAQIAAWPECEAAELRDATIEVRSCAPEALLRRWLAHDAGLDSLEVLPLSLEEAFVSLTAARPTAHEEMAA
jgi:ABC-2 type transport system ATP-binding protein